MKNLNHYFKNGEESINLQDDNVVDVSEPRRITSRNRNHKKRKRKSSDSNEEKASEDSKGSPKGYFPNQRLKDNKNTKEKRTTRSVPNENFEVNVIEKQSKSKLVKKQSSLSLYIQTDTPEKEASTTRNEMKSDTPKTNAFELMMESRNKSIGRNSPGKEMKEECQNVTNREVLLVRKASLQKWNDEKGGMKRKRIEEETEQTIKVKLEERAERLTKMLTAKKKKVLVIDSDSENSVEANLQDIEKVNVVNTFPMQRRSGETVKQIEKDADGDTIKVKMFSHKKTTKIDNCDEYAEENTTVKKSKRKSRLSLSKSQSEEVVPKRSQLISLSTQTPKNWKMKIKVSNDVNDDVDHIRVDDAPLPLRRSMRCRKSVISVDDDVTLLSSDEEKSNEKVGKKNVKLAPIFIRSSPKPTIDPAILEAKMHFLHSGIPDALKKVMDRQKSVEVADFDVFPKISHVQQTDDSSFWKLGSTSLILKEPYSPPKMTCNWNLTLSLGSESARVPFKLAAPGNINFRRVLKEMKAEYPEFPIYRTFRLLREKICKINDKREKDVKGNKAKKGKTRKRNTTPEPTKTKADTLLWTEKYKAQSTADILGNTSAISELKTWLKTWVDFKKEVSKCKRKDSGSEFESTDCDSRDSMIYPNNTVIISGPVASGKTMAVYALANEFGMNILEINASSKRTGKRLLQELQEATQSHQVRKDSVLNAFRVEKPKKKRQMCLLLIEDVDVVFEQDEGFLSALSQLLGTSKRPVVLVTSDVDSPHLGRFTNQYRVIEFKRVSDKVLASWLQVVCLLEGLHVKRRAVLELLQYNRGDVRRTLLQLQFWGVSGGNLGRAEGEEVLDGEASCEDDDSSLFWLEEEKVTECESLLHDKCINSFVALEDNILPYHIKIDTLWWNFKGMFEAGVKTPFGVVGLLESYSFVHSVNAESDATTLKDSLELGENFDAYTDGRNVSDDIARYILDISAKLYGRADVSLDVGLPNLEQKRWCKMRQGCDGALTEAVPCFMRTDRRAISADYVPALRSISRSEHCRFSSNNKRGNRFYNYLQSLGVDCNEAMFTTVASVFK